MEKRKAFASRRPLLSALLLIPIALVVSNLAAILVVVLTPVDQSDPILALLGALAGTLFLVLLLWRLGGLKAAGVTSLGSWKGWLATLVLLAYYLLALSYAFFAEFRFDIPPEALSGLKVPSVLLGALFEEILFRSTILFVLLSAWGSSRKRILQAVALSTLLFGAIHAFNALAGDPREALGQIAIALLEGVWWAALLLRWGSLWPVVLIHAATNWILQAQALRFEDYHGTASSYGLALLFGLPLAALGVWWLARANLEHYDEVFSFRDDSGAKNPPARSYKN
jgi:membrane protease YdiL (CAAX protease family)